MNVLTRIAGATLVSVCVACGGGGSTGPSLTISPSTLTITSGSTPAGFTATLTGSSSPIAWSLAGPGSISNTSGTTTSYTPPISLATATTATLTATAGTLTATATITINPPAINLTVSPQTATVPAGGSATTFTATLTGSSNTIAWALSGPGSISAASGTTTVYTPPVSVPSTATATLTASAGASLTASATITVNVPPAITVTGSVIALNGTPVSGASVSIGTANTLSDANGNFTLANVIPPYQVVAVSAKTGIVYEGLSLTNPTIIFPNLSPALPNSGTVSGNVTPATSIGAAGVVTDVGWGSPETSAYEYSDRFTANPFSLPVNWAGPSSTTGNLHVLQWTTDTNDAPSAYTGYQAKTGVVIAASGTTTNQNMAMGAVTSSNLSGTTTLPTGYTITLSFLGLGFSDGATLILGSTTAASFSWVTPNVGGTMSIGVLAQNTTAKSLSTTLMSGLAPGASAVSVVVPGAATPGLPADGAAGITTANAFTWTGVPSGVHLLFFGPATAGDPTYYVFTTGDTVTIPDLTPQGLGLPSGGASYNWTILAVAPFASMDAFAVGNSLSPLAQFDGIIIAKPPNGFPVYSFSESGSRTFTTQ
jgi:hypothetical protein